MSGWAPSDALSDVYVYHAISLAQDSTSTLLFSDAEPTPIHDNSDGRNHVSRSQAVVYSRYT